MPAGATYIPISTYTLASNQGTLTFSSIPQTYTDLRLVISGGFVDDGFIFGIRVGNGSVDSGGNYSFTWMRAKTTTATSGRYSNMTLGAACEEGKNNLYNLCTVDFMNYSNTSTYKTWITRKSAAENTVDSTVNLWRSTSAINTIAIAESGLGGSGSFNYGNMLSGTTFTLYGIAAA